MYNFEKAQTEANKIKEIVGEEGGQEDYVVAQQLLEESGDIELVESEDTVSGVIEGSLQREENVSSFGTEDLQMRKKEVKPYVYKEINRLGERLVDFKKKARLTRNEKERKEYEVKASFFREELEKAKALREEVKDEIEDRELKVERLLKGRLEEFKDGTWESMIPEVDAVQVYKSKANREGRIRTLGVNVFWLRNGEKNVAHFELLEDGSLVGKMPVERGLNIDKNELVDDILYTIETVDMSFFENIRGKILHAGSASPEKLSREVKKESPDTATTLAESVIDPRRLNFMSRQGKVLFGITSEEYGFGDYHGFVFPNFVVLENEKIGKAAFFIKFPKTLTVDQKRFNLPPERRLTHEERKKILEEYIEQYIGADIHKLASMGAERKYHPHMDIEEEKWEKKMQQEIDRRLTESGV